MGEIEFRRGENDGLFRVRDTGSGMETGSRNRADVGTHGNLAIPGCFFLLICVALCVWVVDLLLMRFSNWKSDLCGSACANVEWKKNE